ncbi:hypothetical protein THAOC_09615 [Thalassiosira oceanica]|uniref:Uncharacterized protein n=1 Tax=Thalassiosira oceanica TaxID=159749 RepID=K0SW37_THAOC|nr:hypothetical protein THAOC_09615 [Thalassiosira oceanica]|eukprot:EJK69159.1 hypothetical protein THAOC_09615 [Thalassiosira oceanica]
MRYDIPLMMSCYCPPTSASGSARPPLIQAAGAERVAAGQAQRVLRVLEAYPARLVVIGDDGSTAVQCFGHADSWREECTASLNDRLVCLRFRRRKTAKKRIEIEDNGAVRSFEFDCQNALLPVAIAPKFAVFVVAFGLRSQSTSEMHANRIGDEATPSAVSAGIIVAPDLEQDPRCPGINRMFETHCVRIWKGGHPSRRANARRSTETPRAGFLNRTFEGPHWRSLVCCALPESALQDEGGMGFRAWTGTHKKTSAPITCGILRGKTQLIKTSLH